MAQQYIQLNKGDTKTGVSKGTGAPAIGAGQVALTFDATGMTRQDLFTMIDYLEQYLISATFPPS